MSIFYNAISSSLRVTEIPLVTVDVLVLPNTSAAGPLQAPDAPDNWHDRRILAVVSHKDEWALSEEGALFVYKLGSSSNSTISPELQSIYPIYGKFSIVMSQIRRNTLELNLADTKAVLDQPRSGFSLNITPAEGLPEGGDLPVFYATDIQSLGILVAESKRLREVAEIESSEVVNISQSSSHFSWLPPYILKPTYLPLLSLIPPDLRVANKPLIQRLSPSSAGQSGDDTADIQHIRDEWIRSSARSLAREGRQSLSVRLGTFNVNGKMPSQDLSSWIQGIGSTNSSKSNTPSHLPTLKTMAPITLPHDKESSLTDSTDSFAARPVDDRPEPDIFAIGFQELDLSTEALIYSTGTVREEAWSLAIFAALGEKSIHYEKLVSKQLVGMLIIILVKKNLKSCFQNIQVSSAGSGILGRMGNKGATAIRLIFIPPGGGEAKNNDDPSNDASGAGPLTLTFVNSHLAAFDEMTERRNSEFHELSRRVTFGRGLEVFNNAEEPGESEPQNASPTISLYETDVLFWMGDLNYRVDLADAEFRKVLADKEWVDRLRALARFDQLKKSMLDSKVFNGFAEHEISFLPTYRMNPELGMDDLGYDRGRRPAWTDRILYISGPFCDVQQVSYDSYPKITMSDHRPVAGNFLIHFDHYEWSKYESSVKHLSREVHDMDGSNGRPTVTVDQSFLDFGKIRYDTSLTKEVVIQNTGKVPCAWRFVPSQMGSSIHPDWLVVEPLAGMSLPGEKIKVEIGVKVNKNVAASFNLGPRDISGTLILHTLFGKDHFIAISGEYLPTCFGNKLTNLVQLPGPIRALNSPGDLRGENQLLNAPKEIMRLVNRLMSTVQPMDNIFLLPPDEDVVAIIRECLDTGEEFPWLPEENETEAEAKALHAFAHTLVSLLDSLIEPIVPPILHHRCVQVTSRDEAFELLDALQPAAINVWITVTAFLHFACQSSRTSNHAEKIADIFTSVLMKDDPTSAALPISPMEKRKFFLYFII